MKGKKTQLARAEAEENGEAEAGRRKERLLPRLQPAANKARQAQKNKKLGRRN